MDNYETVISKLNSLATILELPNSIKQSFKVLELDIATYNGNRLLLVIRPIEIDWCLLDGLSNNYRADKLDKFKFYYSQTRDAQFYYIENTKLSIISPFKALRLIAEDTTIDNDIENNKLVNSLAEQLRKLELNTVERNFNNIKFVNINAHVNIVWSTDDILSIIKDKQYEFFPKLNDIELIQILTQIDNEQQVNKYIVNNIVNNIVVKMFGHRLI